MTILGEIAIEYFAWGFIFAIVTAFIRWLFGKSLQWQDWLYIILMIVSWPGVFIIALYDLIKRSWN
jgi:hypothetical protein